MRRLRRWLTYFVVLLLLFVAGLAAYVVRTWDRVYAAPLPDDVQASTDPAVIARGEYLAYGPAHCIECHGAPDALSKLADGQKTPLSGGLRLTFGPLGAIYARNLTPDPETGIRRYSDALVARMMRWAVRPDGRATIEPLMPFGNMSRNDLIAIVSFLRSQPPVRNPVPANEWTTMGKVLKSVTPVFKPRAAIDPPATTPTEPTTARGDRRPRSHLRLPPHTSAAGWAFG